MSNKILLTFSSKDRKIDWELTADLVRDQLSRRLDGSFAPRVLLIPSDKFMTVLPVNGFPEYTERGRELEEADVIVIVGKHASKMARENRDLRSLPRMSLSAENIYPLIENPSSAQLTNFLSESARERAGRIAEQVIATTIGGLIIKAIELLLN